MTRRRSTSTACIGHKVDFLRTYGKVCFTVYGNESIKEEDWAPYVQSTVVFGHCHLLENNADTMAWLKKVCHEILPLRAAGR